MTKTMPTKELRKKGYKGTLKMNENKLKKHDYKLNISVTIIS